MKLHKNYPGQRITLNELKWQQQEYCNAINEIYSLLNPKLLSVSGFGMMLHTAPDEVQPLLISGTDGTTQVTVTIDNPYSHGMTWGYNDFGDTFQLASMMFQDESETSASYSFNWDDFLINTGESSATDGWLNFFYVPIYYGYSVAIEVDKYLDSVVANRGGVDATDSHTTYAASQQIIPYLLDGEIEHAESDRGFDRFIKVYKSTNIFGANDFATDFTYWSLQPHDGDSTTPIVIPHRNLLSYMFSVYWDATAETYTSAGSYRIIHQPIIAADMVTYNDRLESPNVTFATNLQKAFDALQAIFFDYDMALSSMNEVIQGGAYDDAVFVSEASGNTLLSGYTENSQFPSGIGTRYDL